MANTIDLIEQRMVIGWERYGNGLLHEKNATMDFKKELVEELLDAIVYAGANVIKNTPQVSTTIVFSDEGQVKLRLNINYELERDGNDAIVDMIRKKTEASYDFRRDRDNNHEILMLTIFTLESVLKMRKSSVL
jgi:hypothetical protein